VWLRSMSQRNWPDTLPLRLRCSRSGGQRTFSVDVVSSEYREEQRGRYKWRKQGNWRIVWLRDWKEIASETRERSRVRRCVHLESEAQQFIANEACGAMKIWSEDFVRPSNPISTINHIFSTFNE
jgi:hypothetical protein